MAVEAKFTQLAQGWKASGVQPRLVLGSASSSRRQIMNELTAKHGFAYDVRTADIDEKAIRKAAPRELVLALAHAKATAIMAKMEAASEPMHGFLLTCDQVVVHEERILEKPESEAECRQCIEGYGRSPASTVGSVVVTNLETGKSCEGVDTAHIHFTPIPTATVDKLLAEGDCMWCAGGLMVEHPLVVPHVTRIDGTQDSVMGLSKLLVMQLLLTASGVEL